MFELYNFLSVGLSVTSEMGFFTSKSDLHLNVMGRRTLESRRMLVEAVASVMKALAEVSPWTLREVDSLNENPRNVSDQRMQ